MCADKAGDVIGQRRPGESSRMRTQEDCSACSSRSRVYGEGIRFRVASGQSFWLRVLPGGITQTRWIPARRILGGRMDCRLPSPFDLSWVLPVDGDSLVPCSLPGPPVVKQFVLMVTVSGFSRCFSYKRLRWQKSSHSLESSEALGLGPNGGDAFMVTQGVLSINSTFRLD